jgi:hypothetical protein
VFANQSESHEVREEGYSEGYEVEPDEAETDEDTLELYVGGEELSAAELEEEVPEASIDELLARRAAKSALGEEEHSLEELVSSRGDEPTGHHARAALPKRSEFVCARCRLVKPRVQLSDSPRALCRDCA